jgi:hypothetical protein
MFASFTSPLGWRLRFRSFLFSTVVSGGASRDRVYSAQRCGGLQHHSPVSVPACSTGTGWELAVLSPFNDFFFFFLSFSEDWADPSLSARHYSEP